MFSQEPSGTGIIRSHARNGGANVKSQMIYARFLEHLQKCGGCLGPRNIKTCKYALPCAVAENLAKKGVVRNSEELISYGSGNRNSGDYAHAGERIRARASLYGIGPCNSD